MSMGSRDISPRLSKFQPSVRASYLALLLSLYLAARAEGTETEGRTRREEKCASTVKEEGEYTVELWRHAI
jgi:hypothetical protein